MKTNNTAEVLPFPVNYEKEIPEGYSIYPKAEPFFHDGQWKIHVDNNLHIAVYSITNHTLSFFD